jgi:pyrroline-5-carboxylate reductase
MAASIFGGLIGKGMKPEQISVSDPNDDRTQWLQETWGIQAGANLSTSTADVIILAVKPQVFPAVLAQLKGNLKPGAMIMSVAAGITLSSIEAELGNGFAYVRTMPNTPALVGCGATGLYGTQLSEAQREQADAIMASVGITLWVAEEAQLDAVTAVSGSGPAYFFLLMESMINSGKTLGLSESEATALTLQTALGAAKLAQQGIERAEDTPSTLREKVTSPGGTTAAALSTMMAANLPDTIAAALQSARDRAAELGKTD